MQTKTIDEFMLAKELVGTKDAEILFHIGLESWKLSYPWRAGDGVIYIDANDVDDVFHFLQAVQNQAVRQVYISRDGVTVDADKNFGISRIDDVVYPVNAGDKAKITITTYSLGVDAILLKSVAQSLYSNTADELMAVVEEVSRTIYNERYSETVKKERAEELRKAVAEGIEAYKKSLESDNSDEENSPSEPVPDTIEVSDGEHTVEIVHDAEGNEVSRTIVYPDLAGGAEDGGESTTTESDKE